MRAHKHNGCSPVRIPYVLRSGVASRGRWGAAAASRTDAPQYSRLYGGPAQRPSFLYVSEVLPERTATCCNALLDWQTRFRGGC